MFEWPHFSNRALAWWILLGEKQKRFPDYECALQVKIGRWSSEATEAILLPSLSLLVEHCPFDSFLEADRPPNRHQAAPINSVSLLILCTMCLGELSLLDVSSWTQRGGGRRGGGGKLLPGKYGIRVWSTLTVTAKLFRHNDQPWKNYHSGSVFHAFVPCIPQFLWLLCFSEINVFPTNHPT